MKLCGEYDSGYYTEKIKTMQARMFFFALLAFFLPAFERVEKT